MNQVRIVLVGKPDAGKTSLLGALGQAARLQEAILKGKLTAMYLYGEEMRIVDSNASLVQDAFSKLDLT